MFVFATFIPKTLLVPFFSGHGVVRKLRSLSQICFPQIMAPTLSGKLTHSTNSSTSGTVFVLSSGTGSTSSEFSGSSKEFSGSTKALSLGFLYLLGFLQDCLRVSLFYLTP